MRVFVLASLSTSAIAASNNAGKLPGKSNAVDDKNAADRSPFGVMLAATAALQAKPQAAKPVSDEDHHEAVKKSDDAGNDASAAPKDHHGAAPAGAAKTSGSKNTDAKTADTKATDSKAADGKALAKDSAAANDNNGADQTAQAQQQPDQQQPAQQPQVPPPSPLPDPNALALAQAQAGATPPGPQIAAAANDATSANTGANVGAVGADSGKASADAAAATPLAGSVTPNAAGQDAANGAASQLPGVPSGAKNPTAAAQAAIKGAVSDSKSASGPDGSGKVAAQTADAAPQPQVHAPQAQPAPQTQPASTVNPAAVPALNFGAPVQNSPAASLSNTVQISAHGADTAATVNTLAVAIAARTQSGARQFDIRLDPPELGRVEVRLSIDASGKTEAHMTADQPETLNLLQKDSSSLTQALRDAGLDVSNSGLNFSLRSQNGQSGDTGSDRGTRANLTASRAIDAVQGAATAISFTGGVADGRLDIHV